MFKLVSIIEFHRSVVQGLVSQKAVATARKISLSERCSPQEGSRKRRKQSEEYNGQGSQRREAGVKSAVSTKLNLDHIHSALIVKFT
ncbi:hypothetical protein PR048_027862 [Dryococelus australis]|uniref:Uncharacterized protein n=1 Tax=Dryococelus australis TaxID=614101 RepID=A0ABQ9GHR6_9NEOP|nr:hypothetical protein PR048_027862 [Dryococelus australis]